MGRNYVGSLGRAIAPAILNTAPLLRTTVASRSQQLLRSILKSACQARGSVIAAPAQSVEAPATATRASNAPASSGLTSCCGVAASERPRLMLQAIVAQAATVKPTKRKENMVRRIRDGCVCDLGQNFGDGLRLSPIGELLTPRLPSVEHRLSK